MSIADLFRNPNIKRDSAEAARDDRVSGNSTLPIKEKKTG
jgi:hypothetical protein